MTTRKGQTSSPCHVENNKSCTVTVSHPKVKHLGIDLYEIDIEKVTRFPPSTASYDLTIPATTGTSNYQASTYLSHGNGMNECQPD
jgi:hypothetical protein